MSASYAPPGLLSRSIRPALCSLPPADFRADQPQGWLDEWRGQLVRRPAILPNNQDAYFGQLAGNVIPSRFAAASVQAIGPGPGINELFPGHHCSQIEREMDAG